MPDGWNKKALVEKVIEALSSELELYTKAARSSHAEATHEQNKAEDKYDTRGLEASYLARGQSRQVAEIEQAITTLEAQALRDFGSGDPIDLTALVHLVFGSEESLYFILPRAGGTEIAESNSEILVLTPQSPLGQQLVGKKAGEKFQIEIGGRKELCQILNVW